MKESATGINFGFGREVNQYLIFLGLLVLCVLVSGDAWAFTAPTSGSLLYDAYDMVVNKMFKGALGYVICFAALAYGLYCLFTIKIAQFLCSFVGAGLLWNLESIVTSMGCIF